MKKRIIVLLLVTFFVGQGLLAQDNKVYSQFFMNPYALNSAYAGATGYTTMFAVYRQQWVGIEGAPSYTHLSFHTPLKGNLSFGVLAYNDNLDAIKTSGVKVTGGYLLQMDKKKYLRVGLSMGGGYTTYDVEAGVDPTLLALSSSSFVTADVGISYYFEDFNVALSVPNLIGREIVSSDGFHKVSFKPYESIMIQVNYRKLINKGFSVEPHIIYRYASVNLPQFEVAMVAHFGHVLWGGLNYRQQAGMAALVGVKIQETWALGVSYELGEPELAGYSAGSFEFSLGYQLGKKKKYQKQAQSFIHNFKKSNHEKAVAVARRKHLAEQRKIAATKQVQTTTATVPVAATTPTPTPTATAQIETPVTENTNQTAAVTETTPAVTETQPDDEVVIAHEVIDYSIPLKHRTDEQGVWEVGATYIQTRIDSSKTSVLKWHDALTETPDHTELPENTFRKGNHSLELPVGHHVIAAQYKEFRAAEDYSDTLFKRGFHGTIVGYVTDLHEYFVVAHKGATMGIAIEEQNKWKKLPGLEHVYILNIVE